MTTSPVPGFHAVVPAGGAGTRLWPLSRRSRPKFLLDLTGTGRTLLQATWDRLVPLTGEDGVLVVTGEAHAAVVREQLPALPAAGLVTEPSGRDSMAAIGLAAADRKSTRLNSSHVAISYAVFCLKKKIHSHIAPFGPRHPCAV